MKYWTRIEHPIRTEFIDNGVPIEVTPLGCVPTIDGHRFQNSFPNFLWESPDGNSIISPSSISDGFFEAMRNDGEIRRFPTLLLAKKWCRREDCCEPIRIEENPDPEDEPPTEASDSNSKKC